MAAYQCCFHIISLSHVIAAFMGFSMWQHVKLALVDFCMNFIVSL